MSDAEKGLSVAAVTFQHSSEAIDTEDDDTNRIQLQLRLLTSPRKIPKWMKHYRLASYILYGTIAVYALFYLVFIGINQANPRMLIQYASVVRYLEYNSYSILSPLLCPFLMARLALYVRHRVKLDEGDFFGILGVLLLLSLVNFYDAWGVLKLLHWHQNHDNKIGTMKPPTKDESSRKDMHWQYAWSTKTTCARKYVRALQYNYAYNKKHVVRHIIFDNSKPQSRSAEVAQEKEKLCNLYHAAKTKAVIRTWMKDLQKEYKCCGPYGYKEWVEWFDQENDTGCNKKWIDEKTDDIPSCFDPLMRWLDDIMLSTFWVMVCQGVFYIISMFLFMLHHSAMKLESKEVEKKHSLLSMTDHNVEEQPHWYSMSRPADRPQIVGEYPPKPEVELHEEGNESKSNIIESVPVSREQLQVSQRGRDDSKSSTGSKKRKKSKDKSNRSSKSSSSSSSRLKHK